MTKSRIMATILGAATLLGATAPAIAAPAAPSICIETYNIDHTEITDDSTILFHMRDGSVYRNRLAQRCSGLKLATNGFTYEPTVPGTQELCGNLGIFHVNEGIGEGLATGSVCAWGPFDRIAAPR